MGKEDGKNDASGAVILFEPSDKFQCVCLGDVTGDVFVGERIACGTRVREKRYGYHHGDDFLLGRARLGRKP